METRQKVIILGENIELGERAFLFSENIDFGGTPIGLASIAAPQVQERDNLDYAIGVLNHIQERVNSIYEKLEALEAKIDYINSKKSIWQKIKDKLYRLWRR